MDRILIEKPLCLFLSRAFQHKRTYQRTCAVFLYRKNFFDFIVYSQSIAQKAVLCEDKKLWMKIGIKEIRQTSRNWRTMLRELATENWAVTISVAPSFSCNKENPHLMIPIMQGLPSRSFHTHVHVGLWLKNQANFMLHGFFFCLQKPLHFQTNHIQHL
jgi:hypothetical protein